MNLKQSIVILILSVALGACEKEEKAVILPAKDDSVQFYSATMGEHYTTQVFANIETGEIWSADNESWDLQLESSPEGYLIAMNGGKGVYIGNAGCTSIHNLNGSVIEMRWDNASGMADSIVLGKWRNQASKKSYDSVYVIDRGTNSRPGERDFQFQIKSVDDDSYTIRFARVNGSSEREVTIPKDHDKLHVYFSFNESGKVLNFEPPKNDWHLCFMRYRWIYYEFSPPLLYTVCGVNINTGMIEVAIDSTMDFSKVKLTDVLPLTYKDTRDVIGFDWKIPDFSKPGQVTYVCRKFVNYFVRKKNNPSDVYKLHFIGFYDKQGLKGTPQFEVGRISN